jgi:hypothetical protein
LRNGDAGRLVSDIFREIDEELRRDNFAKLWQRYGKYIIALALAVVVATALGVGWREYRLRERQAEGVRYSAALELAARGKSKDAANALAAMAGSADGGRAVLVRFEEAALAVKTGNAAGALTIYDEIAASGSYPRIYRDLATVFAARFALDKDPKQAIDRLQPLTDAANPWHPSALELTALAELKQGDKAAAKKTYQRLADDLTAPAGARARATEMIAALGP